MMKHYILLTLLAFVSIESLSSNLSVTSSLSKEIEVCGASGAMVVTVKNNSSLLISGSSLEIGVPEGIFVNQSSYSSNQTIQSASTNLNGEMVFVFDTLQSSDSIELTIHFRAGQGAINKQKSGFIFRNTVFFKSDSINQLHTSESYNILYPVILMESLTSNTPLISGSSGDRSFSITNSGFGSLTSLTLVLNHSKSGLQTDSVSIGSYNKDTLFLSSKDFVRIGNLDSSFDHNETFVITEHYSVYSCNDEVVTTTIENYWGCDNNAISGDVIYLNQTVLYKTPSIRLLANDKLETCISTDASAQELIITNNGNGVAKDVVLTIFKSLGSNYNSDILSAFNPTSFRYKVNSSGTFLPFDSIEFQSFAGSTLASCFTDSSIGHSRIYLAEINPGDTIFCNWEIETCCAIDANSAGIGGWKSTIAYGDICGTKQYETSIVGQPRTQHAISFITETPIEISTSHASSFNYIVDGFANTLPAGPGAHYVASIQLDSNIIYQGSAFTSNNTTWTPTQIQYDSFNNIITIQYPADLPFNLNKSELKLTLIGVCGAAGWKDVTIQFGYVADSTCSSSCIFPLCNPLEVTSLLQCAGTSCDGIKGIQFEALRITNGLPDNNLDGLPDNSGSINETLIRRNRAMVGDTIAFSYLGVIPGSTQYNYARFTSNIDYGKSLSILESFISIYDSSLQKTTTVFITPDLDSSNGYNKTVSFDLSVANLASTDSSLQGFKYAKGDSIHFVYNAIVNSSVPGNFKETTILNDCYLSTKANPSNNEKASCNVKHGRITLIGYDWLNSNSNKVTVRSCSNKVNQNFGMSIGQGNSNYAGGNLFPYEYRHFGILKQVKVRIPKNYEVVGTKIRFIRTKKTNATVRKTISISPDTIIGDTLFYNIEKQFDSGVFDEGDDGFNGFVSVEFAANCDVPQNTFEPIDWIFDYQSKIPALQQNTTITANAPDNIRYLPSELSVICDQPRQKTISRKLVWDYRVNNATANRANFVWMHVNTPSNIVIDSIVDVASNQKLDNPSDIYLIGTVNPNSTTMLKIYGSITNCDTAQIETFVGYECVGYPNIYKDFNCPVVPFKLYIEPVSSNFQTRISGELTANPCSPVVKLKLDVLSVDLGNLYNMKIHLISPDSSKIKIQDDSSYVRYNIANPNTLSVSSTNSNSTYTYDVNDFDTSFSSAGVPGATDLSNNRYYLYSSLLLGNNFVQGDYLEVAITSEDACKVTLEEVRLAYDPTVKFSKDNTAGLHLDIGNSWSGSWGDYDNDGYDDLFIPVNDLGKKNILYHNNGNGSFDKVTTGEIVSHKDASISGSWGDYDNDGFLDLFVANNINSPNRLYHNNGNGTFTSIENNPIVDNAVYSHSAAWADYNNDGNLDLVVSDFHPTHFNFLFQGDGQGGFIIDKTSVVSQSAKSSLGVAWADYDSDGDQDLFIANTNNENNQLFINNNGVLKEVKSGPIVNDGGNSVGGTWGDYDNDGDLDLFVTNNSSYQSNFLYENNGDGTFDKIVSGAIVTQLGNSHGASWIDYDNDGDVDLIVANDQNQRNYLYSNNGDKTFTNIENAITIDENDSYGTAWSDFDRDGDYDLFISNRGNSSNDFFINSKGSCTNHIIFKLSGCNSNSYGIGAVIKVRASIDGSEVWQTRHISTQTSALGGQNSSTILFGLKSATVVDSAIILWPSGIVTEMDSLQINKAYTIQEQCGSKVSGIIYQDANRNGKLDSTESGIPNQAIEINPGRFKVFTNKQGAYSLYLDDGNYTLTQKQDSSWHQISPSADSSIYIEVIKSSASEYKNLNFGDTSVCNSPDLSGYIGASAFRRGLINKINVVLLNDGAVASNDSVELVLKMSPEIFLTDSSLNAQSDSNGNRVYTLVLPPMPALSDTLISLSDSIDVYADLNDTIFVEMIINYNQSECDSLNNSFLAEDIVVGSLDPNDKQVFVSGCVDGNAIERSDRIIYKIRFQNVGNYEAQMVHIYDTLSNLLDWSTLELESSSHPFDVSFVKGVISWSNTDINLPDSGSNLLMSMGYVKFSILPRTDAPPHVVINNSAQIQFDRNDFIRTNTTKLALRTIDLVELKPTVLCYPNPSNGEITVKLIGTDYIPLPFKEIALLANDGATLRQVSLNEESKTLTLEGLSKGVYTVRVISEDEVPYFARIIYF